MNASMRSSSIWAAGGGALVLLSLLAGLVMLPDAHRTRTQKQRAAQEAQKALDTQREALKTYADLAQNIQQGRKQLEDLESRLPKGSVGELQWDLSRTLHQEAQKAGVRLATVKFGLPSREGAKGTEMESLEVEFTALGIYQAHKKFMLSLEKANLPFAVSSARLEESPEGARLGVTLRTFRRVAP
ncbi:hypothetical protein [Holophaga foetida]|uniref:hypothetical protein n=1 Tax=Holophaga foetida TaxID=35839 RepID=UPI0002472F4F|nr:hypothetical protein [Holophaga foetida]